MCYIPKHVNPVASVVLHLVAFEVGPREVEGPVQRLARLVLLGIRDKPS